MDDLTNTYWKYAIDGLGFQYYRIIEYDDDTDRWNIELDYGHKLYVGYHWRVGDIQISKEEYNLDTIK